MFSRHRLDTVIGALFAATLPLIWTLRLPLAGVYSGTGAPSYGGSIPSVLQIAAALVLGALLASQISSRLPPRRTPFFLPLTIPLAAWLFYLPLPVPLPSLLGLASGRFLAWLCLVCLAASIWEIAAETKGLEKFSSGLTPNRITVLAFALYFTVALFCHSRVGLSGDEPHYLLITESLLRDGDLAVQNNYEQRDFEAFYQGKIGAHLAVGTPYSVHGIGLALLMLPGFAIFGLTGVALTEAVLAAILVRQIFGAALAVSEKEPVAILVTTGFGLSVPGLFQSVLVYPELPMAVLVALVLRQLVAPPRYHPIGTPALGFALGLCPLLHVKFLPLAAFLAASVLLRHPNKKKIIFATVCLGALVMWASLFSMYGSPNPLAGYGRQRVFLSSIPEGFTGLWMDQEFGIFSLAPFFVLGWLGLAAMWRSRPWLAFFGTSLVFGLTAIGGAHPLWSGGSSPAGRFVYPCLPVLTVAGAWFLAERERAPRKRFSSWIRPMILITVSLGLTGLVLPEQPLYLNGKDGTSRLLEALSGAQDLTLYLPSIVIGDPRSVWLVGVAAFGFLLALSCTLLRLHWRYPPLAASLIVGVLAVDLLFPERASLRDARVSRGWLEGAESHWDSRFLIREPTQYLDGEELGERLRLPLVQDSPISLPAGSFELFAPGTENSAPELRICNGEGCFVDPVSGVFESPVGLAQFRLDGVFPGGPGIRLSIRDVQPKRAVALRSLGLEPTVRLHGLDDGAYLDPAGFWVRGGERAQFLLEAPPGPYSLSLRNGFMENWVELVEADGTKTGATEPSAALETAGQLRTPTSNRSRFRLGPGESRVIMLNVPAGTSLTRFVVHSEASFRPMDRDAQSDDDRSLGVFVSGLSRASGLSRPAGRPERSE